METLEKLTKGDFPKKLKDIFFEEGGLFPEPREISFSCSCPDWQERYMERLNQSYAELLNSDMQASEKSWTLERKIRQDKQCSGVIVRDISRSRLLDIMIDLMVDGVIREQDLHDFSENCVIQ